MRRLNASRLRSAARAKGDKSGYAIAQRTGLAQSTVYRLLAGQVQPNLATALRLSEAYDIPMDELVPSASAA